MPELGARVERPELEALAALNFRPYYTGHDVWRDDPVHVGGLHTRAFAEVMRLYGCLKRGDSVSNVVIQGRPGIGKTHFIGRLRAEVVTRGDVFVLFQLASADQFWPSLVISYMELLSHLAPGGRSQAADLLKALFETHGLGGPEVEKAVKGAALSGPEVKALRSMLRPFFNRDAVALDTAIALILYSNVAYHAQDVGQAFLQGIGITEEDKAEFGFLTLGANAREVIKIFDRVIALSGKISVVAIDQLDGLIAVASRTEDGSGAVVLDTVATGLMDFAQECEKSLIIVSCLIASWRNIEGAVISARDRFPVQLQLELIPSPEVGCALLAAYFAKGFVQANFRPPYPTWPIHPKALASAQHYTPRGLLLLAEEHIRRCREDGRVQELWMLNGSAVPPIEPLRPSDEKDEPSFFSRLDAEFQTEKGNAVVKASLEETTVDTSLPKLLNDGLAAFADENPHRGPFTLDPVPGRNPPLHARLRKIVDAETEFEIHASFRAIYNGAPTAAINRLRAAVVASGLNLGSQRRLYILRNLPWSSGQVTQATLTDLRKHGGRTLRLDEESLKIFAALGALRKRHGESLSPWLRSRRQASASPLFVSIFGEPSGSSASEQPSPVPPVTPLQPSQDAQKEPEIKLGDWPIPDEQ